MKVRWCEKRREKLWNGNGPSAGCREISRRGVWFCLYPDFYRCPQKPKRNHLAKLEYFFILLHNFHPLNYCKVLEKEESKNYCTPPGQITPTKTSQMFGSPLFIRKKIKLILYISLILQLLVYGQISSFFSWDCAVFNKWSVIFPVYMAMIYMGVMACPMTMSDPM